MSDEKENSHNNTNVTISAGDISGQIAVGQSINQQNSQHSSADSDSADPAAPTDPAQLRPVLSQYFDLSELERLCFELAIDHENLPGRNKDDKVRELIKYCQRHDRYDELTTLVRKKRPHAFNDTDK